MGVMKRLTLLAILLSTGTLSLAAAAYQAPAQPQGPRVIDIEKLKDNLYVLTSSKPGDPSPSKRRSSRDLPLACSWPSPKTRP